MFERAKNLAVTVNTYLSDFQCRAWCSRTNIACTQALFFFIIFVLFENIGGLASEASARERAQSARKKNKERLFSSSLTPTPLRWRSINPLWFIFYHPRSTDFEEEIESL